MIHVTKAFMPDRKKLDKYIDGIYERAWLTNNGQLLRELTERLQEYLGVTNLLLVSNGTLALQIAYRALGLNERGGGEPNAVTTPFTFVATASSLEWEGIAPKFADIDASTWCVSPENIGATIDERSRAVVPVHVFGNACDVEAIEAVAGEHGLPVVYDGAHAFGVTFKGQSLLSYGDATTLSFHATKLFHTIEGGGIIFRSAEALERAKTLINFGITGPESIAGPGINAKMNEFQAAMGLCVLDEMNEILERRGEVWGLYESLLSDHFQLQARNSNSSNNYAYFPLLFESESETLRVMAALNEEGIMPRRYFYPSLDTVPAYESGQAEQVNSRNIAERILCLPLHAELPRADVERVCNTVLRATAT